jgi:hypothetical protein
MQVVNFLIIHDNNPLAEVGEGTSCSATVCPFFLRPMRHPYLSTQLTANLQVVVGIISLLNDYLLALLQPTLGFRLKLRVPPVTTMMAHNSANTAQSLPCSPLMVRTGCVLSTTMTFRPDPPAPRKMTTVRALCSTNDDKHCRSLSGYGPISKPCTPMAMTVPTPSAMRPSMTMTAHPLAPRNPDDDDNGESLCNTYPF